MGNGLRRRAGVASRCRHEDAIVVGIKECQFDRIAEGVVAATDREVDHIDAVQDRLFDGCDRVAVVAAEVATDAIGNHVGARGNARDSAARLAEDAGSDTAIAGRSRHGMRAVAVVIAC